MLACVSELLSGDVKNDVVVNIISSVSATDRLACIYSLLQHAGVKEAMRHRVVVLYHHSGYRGFN